MPPLRLATRLASLDSPAVIRARLPTVCGLREFVEVGMLMSYGPNIPDL